MWRKVFLKRNNGDAHLTENPEKDILDQLIEKTKTLGHQLSLDEAHSDPEMFTPMAYAFYYDNFENAARKAWCKVKPQSPDGLTEVARFALSRQKTSKKEEEQKMRGARYTKEEVVAALKNYYQKTGRLPSQATAAKSDSGLPSYPTIVRIVGPKDT